MDDNDNIDKKDPDKELFYGFNDDEIPSANRTLLVLSDNSDIDEDIEISYVLLSGDAGANNKDQGDISNGARTKTVTKCQVTRPPQ